MVGVVDEAAEWAVVSSNVFLEFSYVRSKWGSVALGDVVHGLMVPDRKGGCDWRCIHVFKVDVGGAEANAKNAAVEAQLAREEQEHRPPNPNPDPNPKPNPNPNPNPSPGPSPSPSPDPNPSPNPNQEHREKAEALAKQDHKEEVEKLKEAMRLKREEERRSLP